MGLRMSADALFPSGFHPVKLSLSEDLKTQAWSLPRILCPSSTVKYYYTDFNSSIINPTILYELRKMHHGLWTPDDDEYMDKAYKGDVLALGRLINAHVLEVSTQATLQCSQLIWPVQKYANVEFLRPLVVAMTTTPTRDRPHVREVLQQWTAARPGILSRPWRLQIRGERTCARIAFGCLDATKLAILFPISFFVHHSAACRGLARTVLHSVCACACFA